MKQFILALITLTLVGCGKHQTVQIDDNGKQVRSNTQRIELLELKDLAQDLRLDALEAEVLDLHSEDVLLQSDIDSLRSSTNFRFFLLSLSLGHVISQIDNRLDNLEDDVSDIEQDINQLRRKVSRLKRQLNQTNGNLASLQSQVDLIEDKLIEIVKPCPNSKEVLFRTEDGLVAYFQTYKNETVTFSDSVEVPAYTIPAHFEQFCVDTNFLNGECNEYSARLVGEHTIPSASYQVDDSASIRLIDKAYMSILGDGNYQTTDGTSCNFSVQNGELQ